MKIQKLAELIANSKEILVFTGAGISTESGISDYRSKGGLWERYQPVTIQEFIKSTEKRKEYWQTKMELYASFETAKPNKGHIAVQELFKQGKLRGVITQNIDGLHQMAGLKDSMVLQIHGTNRETICLSCGKLTDWTESYERLKNRETDLQCKSCKGMLKPNTVSFGQNLDPRVLNEAVSWAKGCDCVLALGSTLLVEPAASIPRIAKQHGAKLGIITMSTTPLDELADIKIEQSIGNTLQEALEIVRSENPIPTNEYA